jgi:glycosyltransferase involved in cell wall biosynthesis
MSRFPNTPEGTRITETFILYEMLALEQQGVEVEVYPLQRKRATVMHPEAKAFVERAYFQPFLSWPILRAQMQFLWRKPGVYLQTLGTLLRANWGSLRFLGGALAFFPKAVYFAQLMATGGVTHVHAHFASRPATAAFIIHRLANIPYSFTAHGPDLHRDQHMLREKVAEAAFVVPISSYNKEMIVDKCQGQFRDKVTVIHCGVDTHVFEPRSGPTPHEQGNGPFTMLCIGTLHEFKGQTCLIEACRLLSKLPASPLLGGTEGGQGIDFACHFIGDGPDLAALTKQVEAAGLEERIHFHGRLTRPEIVALLRGADVVATPNVPAGSRGREGLPVALMEAMGSGVPVVASDLSGISELVIDGQTGLLVAPGDAAGLARALEHLYRHPDLRRRLGQAGREKVVCEFDLSKNTDALAQYFNHTRPVFFLAREAG